MSNKNCNLEGLPNFSTKGYEPWYQKGNYTAHHTNGDGFAAYDDAKVFCEKLPDIHMFMHDSGMFCVHNIPCPVCKAKHACFDTNLGVATPCNSCSEDGWELVKREDSITKCKFKNIKFVTKCLIVLAILALFML